MLGSVMRNTHILRCAVELVGRVQNVLSELQLAGLPVTHVTQLLLQILQLQQVFLVACAQQRRHLLIQLHIHSKPLLCAHTHTHTIYYQSKSKDLFIY